MEKVIDIQGKELLQRELERRCRQNPRYSLRAFAKSLGLSHSIVSLVLSGKRELSEKAAQRVAGQLGLNPSQHRALVTASSLQYRRGTAATPRETASDRQYEQLSLDIFAVISEWHYYAILSLLELPGAQFEAKWISRRLGISEVQAKIAIDRLVSLELVRQTRGGRWKQSGKPIKIESKHSTSATRSFYRGLLEKASRAIDEYGIEERDLTSMTLVMDSSLLGYARDKIKNFRRELTLDLEAKGRPDAVYEFMVQLFPLTDPKEA